MRIKDLLKLDAIELGVKVADKAAAIDKLVALQDKAGNLTDIDGYKAAILKRESESTTAIGEGLAVPHAKTAAAKKAGLAAMTVPDGVDYDAPDGKASDLLFMIAAPEGAGDEHLEILSRLMVMLMDPDFSAKLRAAKTPKEFLNIINKQEALKYPEEAEEEAPAEEAPEKKAPAKKAPAKKAPAKKAAAAAAAAAPAAAAAAAATGYKLLAVTACPTGIAHTYMAAEALEQAGKKLGLPLKAETNGSGGAKNVLTAEEIAAADGIIIAADKNVDMARFDGKPVVKVPVSDGINKPEELIQRIVDGKAAIYHAEGGAAAAVSADLGGESTWHKVYKHLMNGVSHMLPFVVGGGILIAIAFLIDTIAGVDASQVMGDFGTVTPAAAWFKTIGGAAFDFMLPILAGFIAMSIADRPGLAVGMVGGYLAKVGATWAAPGGQDVSAGFLGALLAGFLAGYIVKWLQKITEKLPKSLDGIRPMLIYPLCGIALIAVVMCTVDPVMIWLNTGIAKALTALYSKNLTVLLGLLLGLMMATDMGGPINKAAYLFGTGMLATAQTVSDPATQQACYIMMACVMIGGMVPPIAIALACQLFPQKFTAAERATAPTNYVMGLSFITEGAIPFAAADPGRVIPSMMVGSGIAGALCALFGCTLMAPHGGIFVFATVGRWYLYLLALAVGAIAGMFMLALLKKDVMTKEEVAAEKAALKAKK